MKISTKGKYGLEALMEIAIHPSEVHISLKTVAERMAVSEAYLLQIFIVLRRAGIVESVRGAQGGYHLAKPLDAITVGMVLRALEGPLAPVACVVEGADVDCDRYENCTTRRLWENVMHVLDKTADAITLASLVQHYNTMVKQDVLEYYL